MCNVRAVAGVSTVLKKNGYDQRKLVMQCAANYMFGDPSQRAHLGMGGGSSLARCFIQGDHMAVAACDEDSAFSYVKVPAWMAAWQAAPPVLAIDAWDLLGADLRSRIPFPETTYVAPKYLRLAMGGSHSVYILMRINLHHIGQTLFNYASRLRFEQQQHHHGDIPSHENQEFATREPLVWDEDNDLFLHDDEWPLRQQHRRQRGRQTNGWTVEEWCDAVRRTKHDSRRVFVAIHMFGGERRPLDIQHYLEGMCSHAGLQLLMLTVDLAVDPDWDFASPRLLHQMMALAEEGLIDLWIGGPPCSTVARARHVPLQNRSGPRPLRFRWALWGRSDLRPHERERVQEANTLWLNFLAVAEAVGCRGGGYLMERPADPGCDPYPSIWLTEEVLALEARVGGQRVHFHQCPFGGVCPKLTTLSGNLQGMQAVDGVRCPGVSQFHQHAISIGQANDGSFHTRRLQTYPPGLCEAIAEMMFQTLQLMAASHTGPTGALAWPEDSAAPRVTAWSTYGTNNSCGVALVNEATAKTCNVLLKDKQAAVYVHVDDTVFISTSSSKLLHSDQLLDETVKGLEHVGFQVTQQLRAGELDKVVGYEISPTPAEFRLPLKKMVLLREALLYVAGNSQVSTDVLRSLLGMWIFGSLLRRELLSIPHAVFRFIDKHEGETVNWWPTARREVRAMAHVTCLMSVHVGAQIQPWLFATDAMGMNEHDWGGFGIAMTEINEFEISSLLKQGEALGKSIARADGFGGARWPQRELKPTVPFSLLPDTLFEPKRWSAVDRGRWRFGDHITLGESRTVLKLLHRVGSWPALHDKVIFSLQDNMPTACSMTKGRSPSFPLNRLLRKKAAICLAAQLRAFLPWVESARQPADDMSRLVC